MEFETIIFTVEDQVASMIFNRPHVMNAINLLMLEEMNLLLDSLENNSSIRALVISGNGENAFSAGADLKDLNSFSSDKSHYYVDYGRLLIDRLYNLKKPTIAAINGYAIGGGCELALACDIRVSSPNAKLGFTEATLGSIPSWGGVYRLLQLVGMGRAKELLFTGKLINSEQALSIGLVNRIISNNDLLFEALDMAKSISANSPLSVSLIKELILTISDFQIESVNLMEKKAVEICNHSLDQAEGRTAFIEKRRPKFSGK